MSTTIEAMHLPGGRGLLAAISGMLAFSLAAGVLASWWLGAAMLTFGLIVIARPLDLFGTMLFAACAATFVSYEGGHLTRDLSAVTLVAVYALLCLAVAGTTGRWGIPRSALTVAVLLLAATTALAAWRGFIAQHSLKFLALELLPMLALCSAPMVGGLRLERSELRIALRVLVLVALVHVALGVDAYLKYRARTGGIAFTGIPGMVALIVLNLWLRGGVFRSRMLTALLLAVFMFHQVISFTRGLWLGLLVCVPVSCWMYGRRGPGWRQRWFEVAKLFALVALLTMLWLIAFGILFGWSDLLATLVTRLASSVGTRWAHETASNLVRLIELRAALQSIAAAPFLGHGLGYMLPVYQPTYGITVAQPWVHQTYLLVWLKEGLVGLLALIGLLTAGVRLGMRGAMRLEGEAAGWSSAVAVCTIYLALVGLTNLTLTGVTFNFLIAFLWGLALCLSRTDRIFFSSPGSGRPTMMGE